MLLAEITVGGVDYYGSLKGHAGDTFYAPWVRRMPTLELGQIEDSGKIGVVFGNIVLTNEHLKIFNPDKSCWASKTPCSYNTNLKLKNFLWMNMVSRK